MSCFLIQEKNPKNVSKLLYVFTIRNHCEQRSTFQLLGGRVSRFFQHLPIFFKFSLLVRIFYFLWSNGIRIFTDIHHKKIYYREREISLKIYSPFLWKTFIIKTKEILILFGFCGTNRSKTKCMIWRNNYRLSSIYHLTVILILFCTNNISNSISKLQYETFN